MLDNFAKTWCEPIGNTKYQVKYAFKILHIQKLFQPIVLGLDCDTFTARCWEECWKNLDFGHCFCYSFYSKYLCIFILFHCVVYKNFQFSNLFLWWTKPPKMRIILLTDGPNFWSVNYYTAKNQIAVSLSDEYVLLFLC